MEPNPAVIFILFSMSCSFFLKCIFVKRIFAIYLHSLLITCHILATMRSGFVPFIFFHISVDSGSVLSTPNRELYLPVMCKCSG
ncbi:MAG: hypothetical protein ACLTHX_01050 [Blautia massiliensis (ex Durand et al. 2017)]|uniref:hypothetical protein n=1 Tax=Blautia massiliensis (ex Durand et al. 2017) TaxID=1737424 RepID=UPI0039950E87